MRIAAAAALSIVLAASLARAQETPPPDSTIAPSEPLPRLGAPPAPLEAPGAPFAPVEATRDSLRKPIPSL